MQIFTKTSLGGLIASCCLICLAIEVDQTTIDFPLLTESSGLTFSTRSDDLLFSHNDSGDEPRLFAFDRNGKPVYELEVEKAKARDWEDMCSFEHDGKHWLAVGDVGDNERKREHVSIYVFHEPKEKEGDKYRKEEVKYELKVTYPTGPVNCEALAYDPLTHSFILLTKENFQTVIYQVAIPKDADGDIDVRAKKIGSHVIPMVTGADISRDGKQLAICTYGPACVIERNANEDKPWQVDSDKLADKFIKVPARKQGESICFSPSAAQLWLSSEFAPTPLVEVALEKK